MTKQLIINNCYESEYDDFILYTTDFIEGAKAFVFDKEENLYYSGIIGECIEIDPFDDKNNKNFEIVDKYFQTGHSYDYAGEFYIPAKNIIVGINVNYEDNFDPKCVNVKNLKGYC